MKLERTLQLTAKLGLALSFIAMMTFAGCGGGGSSGAGIASVQMGGARQGGELNLSGTVSTIAGAHGSYLDGTGAAAKFSGSMSVASDGTNLYVADLSNNTIRQIVLAGATVTALAGDTAAFPAAGSMDGIGAAARFSTPEGITTDGGSVYVTDSGNNTIRKIQ